MTTILYVEDEPALSNVLARHLRSAGMAVDVANDGPQALVMCAQRYYDVVLLDRDLGEGMNGIQLGAEIRKRGVTSGVLMITAAGDLDSKLSAFAMGADDYLTKPFELAELVARIRAITNRAGSGVRAAATRPLERPIQLLRDSLKLKVFEQEVELTSTEFRLLRVLEDANGSFLTAEQLCDSLWGHSRLHHRKSLYVHVNKIRSKLGKYQGYLETVKGVGYRLVDPPAAPPHAAQGKP
ncbi:MAG TPA: response regulator transcription factor [Polyangiaceae bacterium]|jgi:two-component system phosphate regulon response regulator PhoB|nr:response regulator transcription factor [Polyangiaceae bacterium]